MERARRRGSPSRGRARGAAGSWGGGSGWASMAGPSSASRKSKLRQWRLLKGAGAAGRATDCSHGWRLDAGPGAATLMSWYTVDTSRSGGSVRVILKDVPRLAAPAHAAFWGFCPGGRRGSGQPPLQPRPLTLPPPWPGLPGAQGVKQPWLQAFAKAAGACSMPALEVPMLTLEIPADGGGPGQPEGLSLQWSTPSCP